MADRAIESARFQWYDGARRLRERPELESAGAAVLDELRRRLGSTFTLEELAALYGTDTDWALDLCDRLGAGAEASWIVDAAFDRYAREAADYGGGIRHVRASE